MTDLYRGFSSSGELLYVGISLSAVQRFRDHRASSGWSSDVSRIEIERFDTREEAETAERSAVSAERPKWNKLLQQKKAQESSGAAELIKHFGGIIPAAKALGVSRQTIYIWLNRGKIPEPRAYQIQVITNGKLKV